MRKMVLMFLGMCLIFTGTSCSSSNIIHKEGGDKMTIYSVPHENTKHEGTWLIWPHHYTYGIKYREELEPIWISMTQALVSGEKIHIIAYNQKEKQRIEKLLANQQVCMKNIDFVLAKSDDVWVRDTGPIFAYDNNNILTILDFFFDGWGEKAPYKKDNKIPAEVSNSKHIPLKTISEIVLEGGAVELDGLGTLLACKSSVISQNRNPEISQEEMEKYLHQYLGITNFIWLEGTVDEDITDAHIDGIARFYDENTLLTVSGDDFFQLYENITEEDYTKLISAKNANGKKYNIVEIPLTEKNVTDLDYKGSYLNFYIGNDVVLLPVYQDNNDKTAIEIIQKLYPDKKIVPIDVTALYKYGGMLHCVTQQQPNKNNGK